MTAGAVAPAHASSRRRAKLKLLVSTVVPAWGRVVVVIVGSALVAHAVGLGDLSGYAIIPGVFMALSTPVGNLARRVGTVAVATVVIACMSVIGAELTRSTAAIAIGLAVVGFALGLLPRAEPLAAAMQLPLLMGFAYSAGQPLSDASALSRGAVILAALPVYILAAAVLFQTDARRPLALGAAAALGGLGDALGHLAAGAGGVAREAELGLVKFRLATARMKDAALPVGGSLDSRAGRLLTVSVQQAVGAAELLALEAEELQERRRERIVALSTAAHGLAAALSGPGAVPPPTPLEELGRDTRLEGDAPIAVLADALAGAAHATAVLRGQARELPRGLVGKLPGPVARLRSSLTPDDPAFRRAVRLSVACGLAGLLAGLANLGRAYWAVFAVVIVLNAPAALDWRRALMRIAGTVGGLVLALGLMQLVDQKSALAFVVAMLVLLPGLLLMPINYAAAVLFITSAVGLLYAAGGSESDFLSFRVQDNLIGVAVVCAIGLLLWRTRRQDWWLSARLTARSLAGAIGSREPTERRDELVTRALQLRTETVEIAAMPDTPRSFAAAWTFVAASEDLTRILIGPRPEPIHNRAELSAQLETIASRCGPRGAREPTAAGTGPAPAPTLASVEIGRMATAVAVLQRG